MTNLCRRRLLFQLAATSVPLPAMAADFPSRQVNVKVAFPAGGPADSAIRAASVVLERSLGKPIVIENVSGANGSLAAMSVLSSRPDGHTLLGTTGTDFLVAPYTTPSARYQPQAFKLVGIIAMSDFVLVSRPGLEIKNVDDLLSRSKRREFTCANWGYKSASHLVALDFQTRLGLRFVEPIYKGAGPILADLAGNHIDISFVPLGGPALEMLLNGKINGIGLASAKRHPALPNLQTFSEHSSLKEFEHTVWPALLAHPETSPRVIKHLTEAMNDWIGSPENKSRSLANMSRTTSPMTENEAETFLRSEHEKYARLVG